MDRNMQFRRPAEYNPSLQQSYTANNGRYKSSRDIMLNDLGFEVDSDNENNETEEAKENISSDSDERVHKRNQHLHRHELVALSNELEALKKQLQITTELQARAEEAKAQSDKRVEELTMLNKQAKQILMKQTQDKLTALQNQLAERDEEVIVRYRAKGGVLNTETPLASPPDSEPEPVEVTRSTPSPPPPSVAPITTIIQSSEKDKLRIEELEKMNESLKLESQQNLELAQKREEEAKAIKDKAKEKLSTASEAIKKIKTEYINLRTAYAQKAESAGQDQSLRNKIATSAQERLQILDTSSNQLAEYRKRLRILRNAINSIPKEIESFRPILEQTMLNLQKEQSKATFTLMAAYKREQTARKALFNKLQELKGNIRVYCRVRPLGVGREEHSTSAIQYQGDDTLLIDNPEKNSSHTFTFDHVFNPSSSQESVFNEVGDLIISVMDGFNVCIFAFGQTGSGKTHTMQGTTDNPGVNIRALRTLFAIAADRADHTQYDISISLMEIYNDKIQDLLTTRGTPTPLKCKQGASGIEVEDLTVIGVNNENEVLDALTRGSKNRRVSSTAMNADSSRSHLVLSVYTTGSNELLGTKSTGKLHLIDLAGSERVGRSGVTGDALKEAQAINSSLSALSNVIHARASNKPHIPYRDSTLTYVLQDSLDKNSKTLMIVQVAPSLQDASESLCSLRFAERVSKVELGKAQANVKKS